ncbi:hypothetical protein JCM3774_000659 [Rhodotorula dairenensis]
MATDPQPAPTPLTGPLLPLLPPKPLNRRLPPLPRRPSSVAIAPGWTCESLVIPAAFPRMFPNATKKPNEPTRDPTARPRNDDLRRQKPDLTQDFERLVAEQLEAFTHPVTLEDRAELERQEQLVVVGNRYRPPPTSSRQRPAAAGPGLTLVFSHANGFYREVWEPVLADLVAELERRDSTRPVEEIWSLDCAIQGDSALLNEDVIGSTFNWAENGRDLLNVIAYYLDSPDLVETGNTSSSSSSLPRRAPNVPPEIGLLDNVARLDSGPARPIDRTYRGRLIVGVGHSLGASATAFAATACPSLFSSVILVDPVLAPPIAFDPSQTALVPLGALKRRGVWPSRKEALDQFSAKPFFRAWDSRILEGYVELGMHESEQGQIALKAKPFYEAITFLGSLCDTSLRATRRLESVTLNLPLHYIFADTGRSMLPEEATTYLVEHATPHATWTRVRGAGHLVSLEKPTETARCLVDFLERTYPARAAAATREARL